MSTILESLNQANPNNLADMLRRVGLATILAGMIPRRLVRSVTSSATQVEPEPGVILCVSVADGAALTIIEAGTAGAGEVRVTYDTQGTATLVFGDGAQTAYRVVKTVLPAGLATLLATDSGTI